MIGYGSRKWHLVLLFAFCTVVGFFMGKLTGGEFISAITILTGLYAAADVTQDQLSRRAPQYDDNQENENLVR